MPLGWKDRVQQAITAGGTGTLTLGAASAGHQALGAADDGKTFAGAIVDGTAWETGLYTYAHATTSLARAALYASSTGSALNVTTAATWFNDLTAAGAAGADAAAQGLMPGGRLTLTSGVPVTTADVTGATTIYYTPYLSAFIPLWDGQRWRPTEFVETALALGTLTAARPYDVFGYLSGAGTLALELLAWTSDTVRATGISIQGGRYCKTGDQTRIYLGTFRTMSTTTTEDSYGGGHQSGGRRFVWNMYNRVPRPALVTSATPTWSYVSAAVRQAEGATGAKVEFVCGLPVRLSARLNARVTLISNVGRAARVGVGVDSITVMNGVYVAAYSAFAGNIIYPLNAEACRDVAAGYHYASWLEAGADGSCNFNGVQDGAQAGLLLDILA